MALMVPLSLALGCRGQGEDGVLTSVTDSAGVEIVMNHGPVTESPAGWAVAPEPVLSIGSVDGPEEDQFYGLAGFHRLQDGRIGLVNAGGHEVRFYDAGGRHLVTYGKRGSGPEEFEAPVLAGNLGDTLIVVDRAHHRLSFVHPDEGFVGLARVSDEVGGFLNPAGTFGPGQAVFGGAFDMRKTGEVGNGMNRAGTFYRSCNPDGSLAADFGDKRGAEFFIRDLEGGGRDARPALIPFGRVPMATTSPTHFFFSDQDGWEIEVYAPDGSLVRLIRQEWDPTPVTATHGERFLAERLEGVANPDQASQMRDYYGGLPLPNYFPPHGAILADRLGYLWVQDFQVPGTVAPEWTVFSPEGARVGRLALPERFLAAQIGSDYVLGVGWDDMGVEFVRMYSLHRPEEG